MPAGAEEGIIRHLQVQNREGFQQQTQAQLFGSGAILNEVIRAADILSTKYGVSSDVWSVTSYKELAPRRCSTRASAGTSAAP